MDFICSFFLTLGKSLILLAFGKTLGCKKNPNPLTKISRATHRIWHKSFSMIQSARIKNWVPELINRLQRFISFCDRLFWFVRQSKIYLIRIKTQKVLHDWGNIFYITILWQYCPEPYLEPNQKSMLELFCKKIPTINVQLCSKNSLLPVKKKRNKLSYMILHNLIQFYKFSSFYRH